MTTMSADLILSSIVEAFLEALPGWQLQYDDFWTRVVNDEHIRNIQGWKLHVSATRLSAPEVLRACAPVLLGHGCHFKFAGDLNRVEEMTSTRFDRAQAGKFITAYPDDEAQFHAIAGELCAVTEGLAGPRILSDRSYRAGSIVQYRYGAFTGVPYLTNDGGFESRLLDPDGNPVTDTRNPWFSPPPWAPPLQLEVETKPAQATPLPARPMLAEGRFEVTSAIRHAARGGVYRATDLHTGREVLLKEARPHIGLGPDNRDSQAMLAHEAAVLQELNDLTPALIAVFTEGDHHFIAEDFISGRSLAELIHDRAYSDDELTEIARGLVELVASVHDRGWVLRDLTSTNVMRTADGRLVLIDVELASRAGEDVVRAHTPGFGAPEVVNGIRYPQRATPGADLFGLGAVLIHLALGAPPVLLVDEEISSPTADRIEQLVSAAALDVPLVRQWQPLLVGLTAEDPAARWSLDRAAQFLRLPHPGPTGSRPEGMAELLEQIVEDGVDQLAANARLDEARLWKTDTFGSTTDPLNVQYGAAGVAAVLLRAARNGMPAAQSALPKVTDWIRLRIDTAPRLLPGLYFGRAGAAWVLGELAKFLGDEAAWHAATAVATRLPVRWPNPDVCHGMAGAGLTMLRFWGLSGDDAFLRRATTCADHLLDAALHAPDGVFWPVPADFDSQLAGICHLGFGHGVAGVGTFLLAAGTASGDPRYLELAAQAGRTLARAADVDPRSGAATWRTHRQPSTNPTADLRYHWCSGASGVGTFLLRLLDAGADPDYDQHYRELVHAAAVAVHDARWQSPTPACHGLAGNGQFLLDLAALTGGPQGHLYHEWAGDLAAVIVAKRATCRGRLVLPDESGLRQAPGYGTGTAGILDFMMRLASGGERLWLVDADTKR